MNEQEIEDMTEETEISLSPHLALTHNTLQNGAANGRNVSLLLKSDTIPENLQPIVEKVFGEKVIKATHRTLKKRLEQALQEKFPLHQYDIWVDDFDDRQVIFRAGSQTFHLSYTGDEDSVTLGDDLKELSEVYSYEDDSGSPVYRRVGDWPSTTYSFVLKGLANIEDTQVITSIFKKKEQEINMDELNKVQDLLKQEQAKVETLETANAGLKEEVESLKADIAKAKTEQREQALKAVISDEDEVVSLMKATAALDDESFSVIVKSYEAKEKTLEDSDLFKRSSDVSDEKEDKDPSAYRLKLIQEQFGSN
jgi:hypothetical protein